MFHLLRLLAPALIPSWNFFDVIADSPRVEFASLAAPDASPAWRPYRPRPAHVTPATMALRMMWNPRWNESLFVTSCAERLLDAPTPHSENEIFRRIAADLADSGEPREGWLAFRVVLLSETDAGVVQDEAFVAAPRPLDGIAPWPCGGYLGTVAGWTTPTLKNCSGWPGRL